MTVMRGCGRINENLKRVEQNEFKSISGRDIKEMVTTEIRNEVEQARKRSGGNRQLKKFKEETN
ncbi:25039_t:CDS:2 [Gigaspora rosea]|nr:25039_t:CDS:2 [Gigaspora rosea]